MTTLEELRVIVEDTRALILPLFGFSSSLRDMIENIHRQINGEFADTIDVDQLITIQAGIYTQLKADILAAYNALP